MITVQYNKTVTCPVSRSVVENIAAAAARHEKKVRGEIEVSIVGDTVIRRLNRDWRGKDKVTDVLSFAWNEQPGVPSAVLAQIYICYPQIKRQAKRFKVSVKEEFSRMLIHGILHSVGYDHITEAQAKKMFGLQEKILTSL